jgi:hypothetical protein
LLNADDEKRYPQPTPLALLQGNNVRRLFHEEKQVISFGLDCPDIGLRDGAGKLRR